MSQLMTGKQALLEMLKAEGVEFIFGNPGTSEGPIIDLLADYPELRYVLTLQESVAMGMGEAYARGTGRASFVSLHVDSGLANGIALMLDALNTGSPMVVTSANYDIRKTNETLTDLANLVRPVTKWSVELSHPDQIPSVIRAGVQRGQHSPEGAGLCRLYLQRAGGDGRDEHPHRPGPTSMPYAPARRASPGRRNC